MQHPAVARLIDWQQTAYYYSTFPGKLPNWAVDSPTAADLNLPDAAKIVFFAIMD